MYKLHNFVAIVHVESRGVTYTCAAWKHAWWLVQTHVHVSAFTRHMCWLQCLRGSNVHNNKWLVNFWHVCETDLYEWGRDGVMFMCARVYDVALCGNTIRNVALGL